MNYETISETSFRNNELYCPHCFCKFEDSYLVAVHERKPHSLFCAHCKCTFDCDETQDTWPIMGNNSIYAANASSSNLGLCGKSEDSFQKTYKTDLGTKIYGSYPSADELIAQTKAMLFS